MIDNFANNEDKSGVSPVIGVILMIAITVILGAVIGFYAVELGESTSSNVNAGIQTEETSDGVEVRWTSSGNAERVYVLVNGSEVEGAELSGVGGSMTVSAGENDTVSVVGVDADGNETELQSITTESDTTGGSGNPQLVSGGSESSEPDPSEPNSESGSVTVSELEGDGSSSNPYVITNDQELQAMNQDLDANYVLGNDIDASLTNEWNSGNGFDPVGTFTGSFNGKNYTITGLYVNRTSSNSGVAMFRRVENGTIENVTISNADMTGDNKVGTLVGYIESSTVEDVSVSGTVTGTGDSGDVGGLAAQSDSVSVSDTSSDVNVTLPDDLANHAGGLIGYSDSTDITNSYATGDVTGGHTRVGGFVGTNRGTSVISNSYSTGDVTGSGVVGGFAGRIQGTTEIRKSYSTGSVDADGNRVGGFVGGAIGGEISNSYSTGDVTGSELVGGFVGEVADYDVTNVSTSYSTGAVSGSTAVGGFIGEAPESTASDSYWDTESSGQSNSASGTGLTTSEMQGSNAESNMSGLDFTNTWTTVDGDYPEISGE